MTDNELIISKVILVVSMIAFVIAEIIIFE
jgi:hypothetical protein